MSASLSTYALDSMGFRDLIVSGSLVASFTSLTVYEVRGIKLPQGFAEARQSCVAGSNYGVALSQSVNEGCNKLIGMGFTDSEDEWLKEVTAVGPFALVAVGPTDFIECVAGRSMRMPDDSIATYNSFPSVREILKSLEERVLPPVISSLTLALNERDRYVYLRKVARASAGRTRDGVTIHDIRFSVQGELTLFHGFSESMARTALATTVESAPKLHARAAKYFALAIAEDDQLKRFLFFFLSLEVETHAVFCRIDHAGMLRAKVLCGELNAQIPSMTSLIERSIEKWDNLYDRFAWCTVCAWPHLDDDDVRLFKELKNARDAIAHGRKSEPPVGLARKAELLAGKVLGA